MKIYTKLTSDNANYILRLTPCLWVFSGLFLYDSDKDFAFVCVVAFLSNIFIIKWGDIKSKLLNDRFFQFILLATVLALISKLTVGHSSSTLRILVAVTISSLVIDEKCISFVRSQLSVLTFVSSLSAISYTVFQTLILNKDRLEWSINAIPYTTLCASIAIIALYYLLFSRNNKEKVLGTISYTLSISSILLSETRGTLLAALVISVAIISHYLYHNRKHLLTTTITIICISVASIIFAYDKIESRIIETQNEFISISQGDLNTSIGYRLKMWFAGYEISKEPTLFGLGSAHLDAKKKLYEQGKIDEVTARLKHYHNEYISTFVKEGVLGFISLLSLMLYPLFLLYKKQDKFTFLASSISGVYMICSLTDVPFTQPQTLAFYLMSIYTLTYTNTKSESNC